jgi:hypothetical protein
MNIAGVKNWYCWNRPPPVDWVAFVESSWLMIIADRLWDLTCDEGLEV